MGCGGSKGGQSGVVESAKPSSSDDKPNRGFPVYVPKPGDTCEGVFKMGKQLGSGAYSVVFLGTNNVTNEPVAVKKITKSNLQSYDHDALKDEVALLKQCDYHNIIHYKAFFDEPLYYFVVTDVVTFLVF
jgi:serine/threonine protein kinase